MEATILFVAVAALILLAVTSMRYGVDSRDGFASKECELAARGIIWGGPLTARDLPKNSEARLNVDVPGQERAQPEVCVPAPCGT
jgi:hypothetical protein